MVSYRVRFSKSGPLKYLSHLELIRTIERAIRRAGLPIAYSEGFHPHPKLGFGPALAVGISSEDEYFDLELRFEMAPPEMTEALNRVLPEGLKILTIKKHDNPHVKSLNAVINRVSYLCIIINNSGLKDRIIQRFDEFFKLPEIMMERSGKNGQKKVNIRPWLHEATVENQGPETLGITLTGVIGSEGNMRPEEIIEWLEPSLQVLSINRIGLWSEEKGFIMKPLDFCKKTGE